MNHFLVRRGGDGIVVTNHPAFESPARWIEPLLSQQGMCLQAQKRLFYHPDPTTLTGKISQAFDNASSFQGGAIGKRNRILNECVKIVTDRDGTSIPHCAPVSSLLPQLQEIAKVVKRAWAQYYLHFFPKFLGLVVFRGGGIGDAGIGKNILKILISIKGRYAYASCGNH